ncbi:MAG TPA: TraR/DksA C4-type zinc finger protein [Candidatus Aquicultor sp.]
MDEKELNKFREWLLAEKKRLESEQKYVDSTMDQSQSEWINDEMIQNHLADIGTETFMREKDLSLSLNVNDLIVKVNEALKRIEDVTYGFCRVCGRPIERERLEAIPYTDLCIEDKKNEERSW